MTRGCSGPSWISSCPGPAAAVPSATGEGAAAESQTPAKPAPRLASTDEDEESLGLTAAPPTSADLERLASLLAKAVEAGCSDVHVHSGAPIKIRVNGVLTETDAEVLSHEDTERRTVQRKAFPKDGETLTFTRVTPLD